MCKEEYLAAYSYIRTVHKYGRATAFFSFWDLESLPTRVKRNAARSFNWARKAGLLSKNDSGYDYVQNYCPECGRMLFDCQGEDDVSARISGGPYGDLMCSICARRAWEDEETAWDEEIDDGFYDGIPY